MALKLVNAVTEACIDTCRSHKILLQLLSSRKFYKRRFCSKKDGEDSPQKPCIEDLLHSSSPLRSSDIDDFWATSPYPAGTAFRDFESEENHLEKEPLVNQSIILFPGQGNQFVGMAKNLLKYPVALDLFKTANDILGYNLLKICQEGPEEVLNDTKHCQLATFVCSLALLEKVKNERPWAISNCVATCGYSLGELTALVFAGCINFEQGLGLVKVRAEAMAECCKRSPGGMLTVFVGPRANLSTALIDAKKHCESKGIENPQCSVASYLFPNCKVIAGNTEALDFVVDNAKKYYIRRHSKLPVSGAFHTLLMKDAAVPFAEKLRKIKLNKFKIKVFSNVTAKPYFNLGHILSVLPRQIYQPVKWQQTMQNILSCPKGLPLPYVYECGPGNSLASVAMKNNIQISSACYSIQL